MPDGVIACPSVSTQAKPTTTVVRELDGDKPRVAIRRLENATSEPCAAVPYTVANGSLQATFYKPLSVQTSAQFIVDLTWRFPVLADGTGTVNASGTPTSYATPAPADLPVTTIDFEIAGDPGAERWGGAGIRSLTAPS